MHSSVNLLFYSKTRKMIVTLSRSWVPGTIGKDLLWRQQEEVLKTSLRGDKKQWPATSAEVFHFCCSVMGSQISVYARG